MPCMRGVTRILLSNRSTVNGKPHVAVVKKRVRLKDELVDRESHGRDADETDLKNAKTRRHRDFAEVKAKRRGDVQIAIDVMHVVKAPQKSEFMIGEVPVVEREIQQQKADHGLRGCGEAHQ